jgi:hypothetical protein
VRADRIIWLEPHDGRSISTAHFVIAAVLGPKTCIFMVRVVVGGSRRRRRPNLDALTKLAEPESSSCL